MTSIQRFTAKVIGVRQLTHDVRQIDLGLIEPPEIRFKAGQFVSFEVPDARTGRTVTRPYSIASSPSSLHMVSLLLNLVPHGPGSTYLFGLREGDETRFRGRRGIFTCGRILDGICCLSPLAPALRRYDRCYWPMRIVLSRVARRCFGGCEASAICIMVTSWRA